MTYPSQSLRIQDWQLRAVSVSGCAYVSIAAGTSVREANIDLFSRSRALRIAPETNLPCERHHVPRHNEIGREAGEMRKLERRDQNCRRAGGRIAGENEPTGLMSSSVTEHEHAPANVLA